MSNFIYSAANTRQFSINNNYSHLSASCGGDPNAQAGCGVNCGKRCPNQYPKPYPCPKICYPNSCDCKEGFVYDNNTKQCVEVKDCSKYFDNCIKIIETRNNPFLGGVSSLLWKRFTIMA